MAHSLDPQTDRELLARITRSAGQKVGYKQLIRELGLGGGRERRLLLEQLGTLVSRGELIPSGEDMWALPKKESATTGSKRTSPGNRSVFEGMEDQVRSGRDRLVSGRLD